MSIDNNEGVMPSNQDELASLRLQVAELKERDAQSSKLLKLQDALRSQGYADPIGLSVAVVPHVASGPDGHSLVGVPEAIAAVGSTDPKVARKVESAKEQQVAPKPAKQKMGFNRSDSISSAPLPLATRAYQPPSSSDEAAARRIIADSRLANNMARENKPEYMRLRGIAVNLGLLG